MLLTGADFDSILRDSRAFGQYRQMRMPNLIASDVVIPGASDFVVWTHMETRVLIFSKVSKHFIQVRLMPGENERGGIGQTWVLYHPTEAERRARGFSAAAKPDFSAFSDFWGAWYMEPQPDGSIYCRYVISGLVRNPLVNGGPGASVAMRQFGNGVYGVMSRLFERAHLRAQAVQRTP